MYMYTCTYNNGHTCTKYILIVASDSVGVVFSYNIHVCIILIIKKYNVDALTVDMLLIHVLVVIAYMYIYTQLL